MPKRNKKKWYKKINIKKNINIVNNKKKLLIGISMFCTFCLISTFAWFTSEDSRKNIFKGTQLIAEITEVFEPNNNWQPGTDTTKIVSVVNTAETPAIIRISMYEFLLNFKIDNTDLTGNGNLKESTEVKEPVVKYDDTNTWEPAVDKGGTYSQGNHQYIANQAIVSNPDEETGKYELNSSDRSGTDLKYILINFSSYLKEELPSSNEEKFWFYEDGYFYYSEVLQPGEESQPLLNSTSLSNTLPNKLKGSLYKLKIFMNAHDTTPLILKNWQIEDDSDTHKLIERILEQANR